MIRISIRPAVRARINLGDRDLSTIDVGSFANREPEGVLLIRKTTKDRGTTEVVSLPDILDRKDDHVVPVRITRRMAPQKIFARARR
jgi:hypothetical protein